MVNIHSKLDKTELYDQKRRLKIIAIILSVSFLVLILIITFVPTFIARHLIESEFEKLGIKHSGIRTVRVNLFKGEFWAGPLNVRMSESDPGQLGELGVRIRLFPLTKKRALVESVLIRGIDIVVSRNLDNLITLNGIPLNQFFPKDEDKEKEEQWGIGLLKLDLLDSRMIFREKTGGILTVEIDKFSLRNFHSWHPEIAGIFDLEAKVNDIKLNWKGKARPFADNITLIIDAQTYEVNLPSIIRFTGPMGFKRKDGVFNGHATHNITIFETGRVEGLTAGTLEIIGLNYVREGEFSIMLDRSNIEHNTEYSLSENSDFKISGGVTAEIHNLKGEVGEENKFRLDSAVIKLEDLNMSLESDKSFEISSKTQATLDNAEFSGSIHLSLDTLLNVLKYIQSISSGNNTYTKEKTSKYPLDGKVAIPPSNIKGKKVTSNSIFSLKSSGGEVSFKTSGSTEGTEINYTSVKTNNKIKTLIGEIKSLDVEASEDEVSINLIGKAYTNGYQVEGPNGRGSIEKTETVINGCDVKIKPGEVAVEGSASNTLNGVTMSSREIKNKFQTNLGVSVIKSSIKKGSIALSEEQVNWQTDIDFQVGGLEVDIDKGELANLQFSLLELKDAQVNQDLVLDIDSLTVRGLDLFLTRQVVEKALKINSGKPIKKDNNNSEDNNKSHESMVKEIQSHLKKEGYYDGKIDGVMGPKTESAIASFRRVSGLRISGRVFEEVLNALKDSSGPPISLRFNQFALIDGTKIHFEDSTVDPVVNVETSIKIAEIKDFDSGDQSKMAKCKIEGEINEFTHLELEGSLGGLDPESNIDFNGKIENIELHTYSPYTAEFAGFMLDSGQLTLLTNGISKEGNLDGVLNVELEDLEFTPLSAEDLERLNGRAGLPIETLIGFLEDNGGRIDLELPVGGTISKPDIDIKPAIYKGVGGILKKVFPPTLVASILISGESGDISFSPIKFSPGSKKMDSEAKAYADNLLKLLKEQPKLSLDFCGRSTYEDLASKADLPSKSQISKDMEEGDDSDSDQESLIIGTDILEKYEPDMIELAIDRTSAVRSYLIDEKGADPARIAECRPYFDVNDTGSPRADVSF